MTDSSPDTAPAPTAHAIKRLDAAGYVAAIPDLADLLVDAVDSGASVNFLAGLTIEQASDWWADRVTQVEDGTMTAIAAMDGDRRVIGSTVIMRSRNPNSPHRAEIVKVLVHSEARRRGLGRALMIAIEEVALAEGRWLLLLDTQSDSEAESMYRALGWHEYGVVPDHSYLTDGTLSPTTFFWKDLR